MRFLGFGNGVDGPLDLSSYTQTWYSCSGLSGALTLAVTGTFSPGDRVYIKQSRGTGVGGNEDNYVESYVAGTLTLVLPLTQDYIDSGASQSQIAVVKNASSISGNYTLPDWDGNVGGGLVVACSGLITGTINGNGKGFRGAVAINGKPGRRGEGSVQDRGTQTSYPSGNAGGGGGDDGGSINGGGGGGGNSAAGSKGTGPSFNNGGLAVGDPTNEDIFMGGGGGSGSDGTQTGSGANGGGFVVIYADKLSASLTVSVNGNNGSGGGVGAGGGGGAGGDILAKTRENLGATLTATGGTGGSGTTGNGGTGAKGRIRVETCANTVGTEDPTASLLEGGIDYCSSILQLI